AWRLPRAGLLRCSRGGTGSDPDLPPGAGTTCGGDLLRLRCRLLRRERSLPSADLEAGGTRVAGQVGSRGRVPVDRRKLRRFRPAGAVDGVGGAGPGGRLGRGAARDPLEAVLAARAEVVVRGARADARLGRGGGSVAVAEASSCGAGAHRRGRA